MNEMLRDARIAFRSLARHPALVGIIVVTLAIGIGANTAIFSVVNTVLLRPLPFDEPDRLVMVWGTHAQLASDEARVSYPDYRNWRDGATSFDGLAALWSFPNGDVNLTGGVEPERVPVARVTAGFFEVLGVRFAYGRDFRPEENVVGNHRVAVLSHALWQRLYGGDPGLVGKPVHVNGFPYTVVGILPPDFRPLGVLAPEERVELWRPLAPDDNQTGGRGSRNLRVVGRLQPDVTVESARQELSAIANGLAEAYPDTNEGRGVNVVPLSEHVVRASRTALLVLLGAVGLVLLSACTNVANMLLARSGARQGEFAVRRALGAPRRRIIGQLLTESALLGILGGVAGVALAYVGIEALVALGPREIPRLDEIGIDLRVLAFALMISLAAGFLFGLAPAYHASSAELNEGLRHGSRGRGVAPGRHLRQSLVLAELTLTLVLLVGAGLLIRSFQELMEVEPGFDTERLLTLQLELPMGTRYPEQWQRTEIFNQLLDRIRQHPQVGAVTMANAPPLGEGDFSRTFSVPGESINPGTAPPAVVQLVGPDYFRTLGIPLVAGRDFEPRDDADAPRVAIVNETAARRWAEARAIGGRLSLGSGPEMEVVGSARDVRVGGLDEPVPPIIYVPSEQHAYNFMTLAVRTTSAPLALLPAIRNIVRDVDPEQPIYNVRTMDELISGSVADRRFQMLLLAAFSATALLLAIVGVYGVMSYLVGQRTREIGVRMALGARPRDLSGDIVRESLMLAAIATAAGVPLALAFSRLLSASLFGIGTADPWTYVGTIAILLCTTMLAAFVPARRAAGVDPAEALRAE